MIEKERIRINIEGGGGEDFKNLYNNMEVFIVLFCFNGYICLPGSKCINSIISAMRKKLPYEAPDSEALLFRAEENFCQTFPSTVTPGKFGGNDPDKYFDETEDVW